VFSNRATRENHTLRALYDACYNTAYTLRVDCRNKEKVAAVSGGRKAAC